jgi:hypothetical protein
MTLQDILNLINAEIVANGNQEITADVLRPILEAMIQQPNDLIGDLGDLQTADVSNIVNAINSILSQNVKNKTALRFVSLVGVDTSQDEITFMQQAITAQAPFSCDVGEQMVFYTQVLLGGSSTELQLQTRYYRLLSGDTLVTGFPNDLQYIMPDGNSLVEVVDTSDTDLVIDLGNIASSTVWDAFNGAAGEPFDMNNDMFVIAQAGGEDKVWKWVGGVGTFGNSATLATSADFVDLTAQPSIVSGDLPPKQITVDTYTLAFSDLYRQLYFTEENTALTIHDAYTTPNASYYFRVFFAGSGSHSIIDSEATVTYNFEQGDYVLCEKKYGLNGWIVKKVGGTGGGGIEQYFVEITESGNTGYGTKYRKDNPDNYGDIGDSAIDLGFSTSASSTRGARGQYSVVSGGFDNTASDIVSTVSGGFDNTASGILSTVSGGESNTASSDSSTVSGGYNNTASGGFSTVSGGSNNTANSYASWFGGHYSTLFIGQSADSWVPTDILFNIGNGTDNFSRSNALSLFKNGRLELPSYGNGTFTGTATKLLAVDADGKVIEEDLPTPGAGLETIRAWISPYDEDLEVEQYPGFVVTPAMTMVRAWVVCTEPPTGDDIEIDMVNQTDSNTTIASFTISANTNKSNVVTTFLDTVSEGDVIIFDCTQIGSSNAGGGLQLYLEIIKS